MVKDFPELVEELGDLSLALDLLLEFVVVQYAVARGRGCQETCISYDS